MDKRIIAVWLLLPLVAHAAGPLEGFGWFARVVGSCWHGTFPDGKTTHTHCYSSQFDHFIRGTASLTGEHDGKMQEQFSGDSLFAWNEETQRIEYYAWGSDGSYGRHEAYYEGEQIAFPVRSRKDPSRVAYRSLWRRIDADSFEVDRQVSRDGGWETEMTVLYRKQPFR